MRVTFWVRLKCALRAFRQPEPHCAVCDWVMSSDEGYWYCENRRCVQSPHFGVLPLRD